MNKIKGVIGVEVKCKSCKKLHIITMEANEYHRIKNGELIQDVLPDIDLDERELLISGTCGTCWDKLFGKESY